MKRLFQRFTKGERRRFLKQQLLTTPLEFMAVMGLTRLTYEKTGSESAARGVVILFTLASNLAHLWWFRRGR